MITNSWRWWALSLPLPYFLSFHNDTVSRIDSSTNTTNFFIPHPNSNFSTTHIYHTQTALFHILLLSLNVFSIYIDIALYTYPLTYLIYLDTIQ